MDESCEKEPKNKMVKTIEDLEKVLKVLRTQGVSSFKFEGLEMILTDIPQSENAVIQNNDLEIPSEEDLDKAVGLPVMGIDDPFLTYNEIGSDEN